MNATHALGWALVHSLWQCTLAAAGLAALLAIVPTRAARTRYALATAALALMLVVPLATGLGLRTAPPEMAGAEWAAAQATATRETRSDAVAPTPAPLVTSRPREVGAPRPPAPSWEAAPVRAVPPLVRRVRVTLEPVLPWLVAVWFGGVLVLSARLASGWMAARRLGTVGTRPAPEACQAALARLAARLRVTRPVRVLESVVVRVPAVIGWLRPVVLLPASALTGLTPQQIDALLAHELAHVRRYDYLVNLVQSVIETLLFYHPAVWWVSRRVRQEREHCCDDLAVAVCGDVHFYATALLGMENLRHETPALALAAAGRGGPLINRIRRLVAPTQAEIFPRWIAGLVAVTLAFAIGGGTGLSLAAAAPRGPRTAPDTVLRHSDPTRPLAERWEWARAQFQQIGGRAFWVGYSVRPPGTAGQATHADRGSEIDLPGSVFPGVQLGPVIGDGQDRDDVALLFRFVADAAGQPVLARVRAASFHLPVEFGGGALLWLGAADDSSSLSQLQALFGTAPTPALKEDVVAAVGLHGTAAEVVPILELWLTGDQPARVRAQAAEWLGHQPVQAAVSALARAVWHDPSRDVREEAAEALGKNRLPAATDSLLALAGALEDPGSRREVVEGLGEKSDPRALATLIAIARQDGDDDVQDEAVEALGKITHGAGLQVVIDIARNHADPKVRGEAAQTLAKVAPPDAALRVLEQLARRDADVVVQRKAVEALGKLSNGRGFALLAEFARRDPEPDVRREAVRRLGEQRERPDRAAALLEQIALADSDDDVQREAVEALERLGDRHDARALEALVRLARTHPNQSVRREALEEIAKTAPPDTALSLLGEMLANDPSPDVQSEALHRLADLPDGAGVPAMIEAARTHPNRELRAEAWRRLDESHDAHARQIVERVEQRR